MTKQPYVVRVSTAKMPSTCWGKYAHIAVIETTDGKVPPMISARCKNVVRIVSCSPPLHVGATDRSEYVRALAAAKAKAAELNNKTERGIVN